MDTTKPDRNPEITAAAERYRATWPRVDRTQAARINGMPLCSRLDLVEIASSVLWHAYGPGADLLHRLASGSPWVGPDDIDLVRDALLTVADDIVATDRTRARALALHGALAQAREAATPADTRERGLYRERTHLLGLLAALYPAVLLASAPDLPEYALLFVRTPTGQTTHHIARQDLDLLQHVARVDRGHPLALWDGADKETTLSRIRDLTSTLAPREGA